MKINFNCVIESHYIEERLKCHLYEAVNKASNKTGIMRISGLGVAIASGAITLAMRVAAVGEAAIKGLANIFGSPFSKKCHLLRGVKQLFIGIPWAVVSLAFSTISVTFGALIGTCWMLGDPKGYSESRKNEHQVNADWLPEVMKAKSGEGFTDQLDNPRRWYLGLNHMLTR